MIPIAKSTAHVFYFKAYLASDHVTEATGKTIAITIMKSGAASFSNPAAGATNATECASGWYKVSLGTGDTDTLGWLCIRGAAATIDDVGDRLFVVNATNGGLTALPDTAVTTNGSLVTSGTGTAQVSVSSGQVILQSGTGTGQLSFASGILKVDVDTIKTNPVVNAGTITFPTAATLASTTNITAAAGIAVSSIGASVVTAASIAADAITAAKIADGAIDAATFAAGAINAAAIAADAITDAKVASDVTIASVTGAVGSVTGAVGSVTGAVGSVTGLTASNLNATISSRASQTSVDTIDDFLDTEVQAIKDKTDLIAAAFGKTTSAIGRGTATTGGSTTSIPTSAFTPAGAVADQFKNRVVLFDVDTTTTALRGQAATISASSNSATPTFTVAAMTTAPVSGDTFSVI